MSGVLKALFSRAATAEKKDVPVTAEFAPSAEQATPKSYAEATGRRPRDEKKDDTPFWSFRMSETLKEATKSAVRHIRQINLAVRIEFHQLNKEHLYAVSLSDAFEDFDAAYVNSKPIVRQLCLQAESIFFYQREGERPCLLLRGIGQEVIKGTIAKRVTSVREQLRRVQRVEQDFFYYFFFIYFLFFV